MKKNKRHTEQEKLSHLIAQPKSGLQVLQYCSKHRVSKQSFYNWRKKYESVFNDNRPANDFVSLNIEPSLPEESNTVIAQIKHPNGCVISFYKGCTPSFLSQTIKHL
jgi:hypothetical protein